MCVCVRYEIGGGLVVSLQISSYKKDIFKKRWCMEKLKMQENVSKKPKKNHMKVYFVHDDETKRDVRLEPIIMNKMFHLKVESSSSTSIQSTIVVGRQKQI